MTNLFSKILLRVKPASANTFSRYFNIGGRALLLFATLELGTAFAQAQKIVASLTLNTSVTSAVNSITNRVYISNYINGTVTVVDGSTNTVVATIASLDHPTDIAINEQTNTLYVLSYNPNGAITVIDGAKNSVITSVPLGIAGPRLLAVNTATNKMYVFGVDGNIAVINGSTNAIAAVTLVGDLPSSLIVNQTTNKVYAAYEGDDSDPHKPGGVAVIDGDTNSVTNLSLQLDVRGMALNPVTNKIYVSSQREDDKGNCLNGLISEIDATTSKVTTRIPALCPLDVAVNASTNKVYVVNSEYVSDPGPNLLEIDCKTYTTRTLDLSKEPSFVRSAHRTLLVNPVTNTVYLASTGSTASTPNVVTSLIAVDGATLNKTTLTLQPAYTGAVPSLVLNAMTNRLYLCALQDSTSSLTVIDAAANSSAVLGVGGEPVAVAVNSVTNRVYTAVRSVGTVMVSSGAKNRRIVTIPVAPNPVALAVNPATNLIYVASFNTGKLTVIDGETTSTTMVSVGSGPYSSGVPQAVAVNPVTNKIYLANYASNSVTVVDGATNATTAVPTGHGPFAVAINSITNKIYVANINDATLTVIDG